VLEAAVAVAALSHGPAGDDLTLCLPNEVLIAILLLVSLEELYTGGCAGVCRRWQALVDCTAVKRRIQVGRWAMYAKGSFIPGVLQGHTDGVSALAIGPNGTIYSGSFDHTVIAWSGVDRSYIRTLRGHTDTVTALAVDPDGTLYSGSSDCDIRVWSSEDGSHIRTLLAHNKGVLALALGPNKKLYSASYDHAVRVWSTVATPAHLQALHGHTQRVNDVVVGIDGRVYSASSDMTIWVWSGDNGAHLHTLKGHTAAIMSLAWSLDGRLCSGSRDKTIRSWSDKGDSTILKLTSQSTESLVFGADGTVLAGTCDGICVWKPNQVHPDDPPALVLDGGKVVDDTPLAFGLNGSVFAGGNPDVFFFP
jgi:WD40 repeat protein